MAARNHIELVVKSMRVLETLAESSEGATLRDIAARVGLVKSSVFRILFTLKSIGYVEQNAEGGLYRLTFKSAGLVRRGGERATLVNIARHHLVDLRNLLQESVWLGEKRREGIVLVDVVEAGHPLKLAYDVGDLCPVHATAMGKAIGAHLSPQQLQALLPSKKLPKFTVHTITSRRRLDTELAYIRRKGYAINDQETVEGVILVGAPLFDSLGRVFAGISVGSPIVRCSSKKRQQVIKHALATANTITKELRDAGFRAREHDI